jgi:carboxymethylenebutenolidase
MKAKFAGALLVLLVGTLLALAQEGDYGIGEAGAADVISDGRRYHSGLAVPSRGAPHPGIVLLPAYQNSRSWEYGFNTIIDRLTTHGFVVLGVGWQTFEPDPGEAVMKQLVEDSIILLRERQDVDPARIGLMGFGDGGRYTMLMLSQIETLRAGVAWYGFPTRGQPAPMDLVDDLCAPLLMIHGAADETSPISDIFDYAGALAQAGAYFELKVYSGESHGFLLSDGNLREDEVAQSAFREMVAFLNRMLR